VKNSFAIILKTIHLGSARRVVTLGINGKDQADDFLLKLHKGNKKAAESLFARIRFVAEHDRFENETTFRNLGKGLYEFKGDGVRLYAFYEDDLVPDSPMIIAACGGGKGSKKEQEGDIKRARTLAADYKRLRKLKDTKCKLLILENED
jgi:putative component of toxin-antitoxin plasmid stabilization module